jgi:hypothetical protein
MLRSDLGLALLGYGGVMQTFWLSLGENCLPDGILQRHRLKSFSTPYSASRTNIAYAIQAERNDFAGFLDPGNLRREQRTGMPTSVSTLYDNAPPIFEHSVANGFEVTHHQIPDNPQHLASYERKLERWRSTRASGQLVKFLYHYRPSPQRDLDRLLELIDEFCRLYAARGGNCQICVMLQTQADRERRVEIRWHGDAVMIANFFTPAMWWGTKREEFWALNDDDLIAEMLETFALGDRPHGDINVAHARDGALDEVCRG